MGRFTSIDAVRGDISNPLDLNQYVYCRNNPVRYVDLDGKSVGAIIGGVVLLCAANGLITGGIYKWNGKLFGAGFWNGFTSSLITEAGIAIGTLSGSPAGTYAGTIIGSTIGSAFGSIIEDIFYNKDKSIEEIATSAAEPAAWGIISGVSSSYWKYAINLADEAGSVAQSLMKYDRKFGNALKIFFEQLSNILSSQ